MRGLYGHLESEYIAFAKKVVSYPSYPGQEKELADFFLAEFAALDVPAIRDGAGNIVAVLKGRGEGPNIMFNGHLDVVPEGDLAHWQPYHPFRAELCGRDFIGRGLADLKGGLCAQHFAFREFVRAAKRGLHLPGSLIFALVVMEEPAESMGTEYLFDVTLPKLGVKCDLVYLSEPTSGDLALGQRGKVELVARIHGRAAHSSRPREGINAVEKALPLLGAVFEGFSQKPVLHPFLGESSMTITDLVVSPGKLSVVPDLCEVSIDRRYVPPQTAKECLNQLKQFLADQASSDPEFSAAADYRRTLRRCYTGYEKVMPKAHPPWATDAQSPLVKKSFAALQAIGQCPKEKYWQFGTDGSVTSGVHGIPTIGYSGAEERWAHQAQERINLDAALATIEGYVAMLCAQYGIALEEL